MIDLLKYGYIETEPPPDNQLLGRVTELRREFYTVITQLGEVTALLKGTFVYDAVVRTDLPCVGDFVHVQYNESGASQITRVLPRRTMFSRADFFGHGYAHVKAVREQILAANFDYVFIITSLNNDFNISRILRYLTQSWQSGGIPVVILTKADLVEDFDKQVSEVMQAAPGVAVHAVSAHTGIGLNELDVYLQPCKTLIFLGMSGVGKSSLVNVLMEKEVMAVKDIREDDSRGRHTTTHRQLFMLPSGAMIIDTPGMRELGLIGTDDGISTSFADIEELFSQCRFNNCSHQSEPGCAVKTAIDNGELDIKRWDNYQKLKRETLYVENKHEALRKKSERNKNLAMWSRKRKNDIL
ncbi:MAG: ribosome small subunit-dependent GTPase A [Oscillospiraceae bacterium]|nr:ribosome small subunit-dependent GTPase A [Oscillospiraceae bacterium]